MHTSKQASDLWCPMVRAALPGEAAENRERGYDDHPTFSQCIADRCSMWRWFDAAPASDGIDRTSDHASRRGYCGLAGKPGSTA